MRLIACLLALLASPLAAQTPGTLRMTGEARTGADQRAARFEFLCSSNARNATGVLGVTFELPRHETLAHVFDFNRFEGPDADAGALTRLESSPGAAGRFIVSGSIGVADDQPFVFGLYAARRGDAAGLAALGRVLRPLTLGAARLVWTQGNTRRGGPAITATLDVSAEDAGRLRTVLAPCLPAAR